AVDVAVEDGGEIRAPGEHLVVDGHGARELADPARLGLARAQEPDDVAAIGVEAEPAARERARVGGEDDPRRARRRRDLAVALAHVPPLVPDLAHELAAAVLEHRLAEMAPEAEPDLAELLRRVARDGQTAQGDHPAAVLQLPGD